MIKSGLSYIGEKKKDRPTGNKVEAFFEFIDGPKFDSALKWLTNTLFMVIVLFGIPYLLFLII